MTFKQCYKGTLTMIVLVALACSDGVAPDPDPLALKKGNGGGGPPSGGPVPGITIPPGATTQLLGDGRDFTGANDPALAGGGDYKDGVCNMVVSVLTETGSTFPDSIHARARFPSSGPKRPKSPCVLGMVPRGATLDGALVISIQANWQADQVDEIGETEIGRGKVDMPGCSLRFNPEQHSSSEGMLVQRIPNGWRVTSEPGGSTGVCDATGAVIEDVVFEIIYVEDAQAAGW